MNDFELTKITIVDSKKKILKRCSVPAAGERGFGVAVILLGTQLHKFQML